MDKPHSLVQQAKLGLTRQQTQRLMMSDHMQQALNLLQMPIHELAEALEQEIEQNPLLDLEREESETDADLIHDESLEQPLEFSDADYDVLFHLTDEFQEHFAESDGPLIENSFRSDREFREWRTSLITAKKSLYEHLVDQAHDQFVDEQERQIAEVIAGSLDETGFLMTPLSELVSLFGFPEEAIVRVLGVMQTFDPKGVCARGLQECLLIQLDKGRNPLAYRIVSDYFNLLIQNKIPDILRKTGADREALQHAIYHDIARLQLNPVSAYGDFGAPLIPDVSIIERDGKLIVTTNDEEYLPPIKLNQKYLALLHEAATPPATKEFLQKRALAAGWLLKNIRHRSTTIERIAAALLERQGAFFTDLQGKLSPLTMQALAGQLDLHESTVARAVANKYIDTPRGIFPLRFFFTSGLAGDVSSTTVKDLVEQLIRAEDKAHPLSDQAIASQLNYQGIDCARRTVAKYRALLKIGNVHERRQFT